MPLEPACTLDRGPINGRSFTEVGGVIVGPNRPILMESPQPYQEWEICEVDSHQWSDTSTVVTQDQTGITVDVGDGYGELVVELWARYHYGLNVLGVSVSSICNYAVDYEPEEGNPPVAAYVSVQGIFRWPGSAVSIPISDDAMSQQAMLAEEIVIGECPVPYYRYRVRVTVECSAAAAVWSSRLFSFSLSHSA